MAGKLAMNKKDLLELYQLLDLYRMTYGGDEQGNVQTLLGSVAAKYGDSGGGDIRNAHNPRGAGRKRTYRREQDEKILLLHAGGMSVRGTASAAGCSAGHVQDVLRREKRRSRGGVF